MKKIFLLLVVSILLQHFAFGQQKQEQALIDSLLVELPKATEDTNKVNLLNNLSYNYPYVNPDEGIKYGREALALAEKLSWTIGIAAANSAIGGNYVHKSDYANALDYEYRALKMYEQLNNLPRQAVMLRNIAIVHRNSKNYSKALEYNFKSLKIYETLNDKDGMASMYNNIANVYYSLKESDKILEYHLKSLRLNEELNNVKGMARTFGNLANFYAEQGMYSKAMPYYFKALRTDNAIKNINGVTRNMGNIGETYLDIYKDNTGKIKPDSLIPPGKPANLQKALYYLKAAITKARELKQTEYVLAFQETLSEAYLLSGHHKDALDTYKSYILLRDSIYDVDTHNAAVRQELNYEYGKREDSIKYQKQLTDIKLLEEQKSRSRESAFYLAGIALVLVFSGFMFNRWRITQQQKKIIEAEKKRSDDLLLNILPSEVAEELKQTGAAKAKSFDLVTVLFTDFKDFTQTSEQLSPEDLVKEINYCYSEFDKIIATHDTEKIKTIGDSYMCAGGLPTANETHPWDLVQVGLDLQKFMVRYKQERTRLNKPYFELRIGIHTGPVVAGIVGIKKFAYDIWGDTVNIASRMESSGEVGKVNISGTTYDLVKDKFNCIPRGKIQAKHKGEIDMYFVESVL